MTVLDLEKDRDSGPRSLWERRDSRILNYIGREGALKRLKETFNAYE
jgi:hypothetical protein